MNLSDRDKRILKIAGPVLGGILTNKYIKKKKN